MPVLSVGVLDVETGRTHLLPDVQVATASNPPTWTSAGDALFVFRVHNPPEPAPETHEGARRMTMRKHVAKLMTLALLLLAACSQVPAVGFAAGSASPRPDAVAGPLRRGRTGAWSTGPLTAGAIVRRARTQHANLRCVRSFIDAVGFERADHGTCTCVTGSGSLPESSTTHPPSRGMRARTACGTSKARSRCSRRWVAISATTTAIPAIRRRPSLRRTSSTSRNGRRATTRVLRRSGRHRGDDQHFERSPEVRSRGRRPSQATTSTTRCRRTA